MRVATKLIAAFALHIAILVALLVFHVGTIRDMVRTGYELSETSSRLYVSTVEQLSRIVQLQETASKYAVTLDDGYIQKLEQISDEFTTALERLERLPLDATERQELARVSAAWQAFRLRSAPMRAGAVAPAAVADSVDALMAPLSALHQHASALGVASQSVMAARLASSARAAGQAERISWAAAAVALLLSILVPGAIVRSISRELTSLKAGTHAVARGDFDYRLPPGSSREFGQVARDFNTMTRRLGELDSAQRDFVSKVSHDLKTPLASMRETVNILLDEIPAPLTIQQRTLLALNQQSGERLAGMIAKLLDLSSLDAGTPVALGTHDLEPVARTAAHAAALAGRERALRVTVDARGPMMVRCDAERMRQVLDNLLDNAGKFSPPHASVHVTLRRARLDEVDVPQHCRTQIELEADEPVVLLSVRDHGPGVPPEARETIFERFVQAQRPPGVHGGVGLGLTICREIAHLHAGTIWVDDAPDGGSIFTVLLPGLGVSTATLTPVAAGALA